MTQFEEITQSPETLAAFLSSLPVIDGPWDKEFQAQFCAGCIEKYAVIATYHNGARTGGIVEAESGAVA